MQPAILTPPVSAETAAFWDAAAQGQLLIGHCDHCSRPHYYPRAHCPFCLSDQVRHLPAVGQGRIASFTIMRRTPVPYACGYIELAEGVCMFTRILCEDFDRLAINQPVALDFLPFEGGALPVFRSL